MRRLSIEQLRTAPELAVLAILEASATTAIFALAAVYPELHEIHDPADDIATAIAALSVIEQARALGIALTRYRRALLRQRQHDDLLVF